MYEQHRRNHGDEKLSPGQSLHHLQKCCLDFFSRHYMPLDPAHDLGHTARVVELAKRIGAEEGARLEIVIPAASFHDLVVYPKGEGNSRLSRRESAAGAGAFLKALAVFPLRDIPQVKECIRTCSFSEPRPPIGIEAQVVKDADLLEQSGLIALARTFASAGMTAKTLFHPTDPWCASRQPDAAAFAFDLFYKRLTKVRGKISTQTGRALLEEREAGLHAAHQALMREISPQGVDIDDWNSAPVLAARLRGRIWDEALAGYKEVEHVYYGNLRKLFDKMPPALHRKTGEFAREAEKIDGIHARMRERLRAYLAGQGANPWEEDARDI